MVPQSGHVTVIAILLLSHLRCQLLVVVSVTVMVLVIMLWL